MLRLALTVLVFGSLVVAVSGCEGTEEVHPVSGTVTFPDGTPVQSGVIEFCPLDGGSAARSEIDSNGHFQLKTGDRFGARAGEYRITVIQLVVLDGFPDHAQHGEHRALHPRYASVPTTTLKATVQPAEENEVSLIVEPVPRKASTGWRTR